MTPELARSLLKRNAANRKIRDYHWKRIKRLIEGGRWKFNGDTIKVDYKGDLQDGQHRLRAIVESGIACLVVVVTGVERDAFATIDTMRVPRSYGDVVHLKSSGPAKHQTLIGTALAWLCRYDRGVLEAIHLPENKIENDEVDRKLAACPKIVEAVERCQPIRKVISPAVLGTVYYILVRAKQEELADRMVDTLLDPGGCPIHDPFYTLRNWLMAKKKERSSHAVRTFAMIFKACNAAYKGEEVKVLLWKDSTKGNRRPEAFPILEPAVPR